jgi:hypothetical protein
MITVITGNIHLIIFYLPGPFATLMKKADSFMQKFSLRRLKMGTIIEFLTKLGMTDSRAKFVTAIKTLQVKSLLATYLYFIYINL